MSTQTSLEIKPASQYALLVTMTYGSATVRYCRWTEDLTVGSETFTAEPQIEVEVGENHGGTEAKPSKITMPISRAPFDVLLAGYPFPEVTIKVEQADPTSIALTRRHLVEGTLIVSIKNPSGRSGIVRASFAGPKKRIQDVQNVSLRLTTSCDVPFGGMHCRVDASAWTRVGTVSAIDGNIVTLTIPSVTNPLTELPNARYRRGSIEVEGCRVMLKKSNEDLSFELFELAPPTWVGKSMTIRAGCDKRLSTCKDVWNNEINFVGLGIKIPSRNPLYQEA